MAETFSGIITEFSCSCGFKGKPGSFLEDKGKYICPICSGVVVTMDDIVQEALKMDDEKSIILTNMIGGTI